MIPKERLRGGLERGASADLWRNTLSQIPSIFGRLVYLSSLRNENRDRYEHHGLSLVFGEQEADAVLRESHFNTFSEWICFALERQKADLDLYLSDLDTDKRSIVEAWLRLSPYRNLVPGAVGEPERQLYLSDFQALLAALKNEYGVADPDPDA